MFLEMLMTIQPVERSFGSFYRSEEQWNLMLNYFEDRWVAEMRVSKAMFHFISQWLYPNIEAHPVFQNPKTCTVEKKLL